MNKHIREALVEVLVMFGKVYGKKTNEELAELVPIWGAILADVEGITPEGVRAAGLQVMRTHEEYWPKPATLRLALMPFAAEERDRRFALRCLPNPGVKALNQPGRPLTPEARRAILAGMKSGPRSLLESIMQGDREAASLTQHQGIKRISERD